MQAAATTGKGAESQVRAKHKDEKDSPRISEKSARGSRTPWCGCILLHGLSLSEASTSLKSASYRMHVRPLL